jgi:hypothetical protein
MEESIYGGINLRNDLSTRESIYEKETNLRDVIYLCMQESIYEKESDAREGGYVYT